MNTMLFDAMVRNLASAPGRRDVLRGLVGTGLGLIFAPWPRAADALKKRKRKKKNKKAKPNAFGCLSVDKPCKNADQCCSGICEGKKGQRQCKARGTGTCDQDVLGACTAPNPELLSCNNNASCRCIRTTAGSNFCFSELSGGDCADCQQDADCEALGFPPGTACAPVTEGICAGICPGGMMCMVPCGFVPPVPE